MRLCEGRIKLKQGDTEIIRTSADPLTPAEIVMLQRIHGLDAVVDLKPFTNDKRPHAEEITRLKTRYSDELFEDVFGKNVLRLPVQLSEIGVNKDSVLLEPNYRLLLNVDADALAAQAAQTQRDGLDGFEVDAAESGDDDLPDAPVAAPRRRPGRPRKSETVAVADVDDMNAVAL